MFRRRRGLARPRCADWNAPGCAELTEPPTGDETTGLSSKAVQTG